MLRLHLFMWAIAACQGFVLFQATHRPNLRLSAAKCNASTETSERSSIHVEDVVNQTLAHYRTSFWQLLTTEYKAELKQGGCTLYDMYAERRKNFMGQEVYRLVKAFDATTYEGHEALSSSNMPPQRLPPNHRFRNGTFILLTKQANGSGDFLTNMSLPTSYAYYKDVSAEAVVLNLGPSHLEISMAPMRFASTFGQNRDDITCQNIMQLRFRVDLFAPNVPYKRMVAALSQLTAATEQTGTNFPGQPEERKLSIEGLDEVIRNAILQTHSLTDPTSPLFGDRQVCNVEELATDLAKPPKPTSRMLAAQAIRALQRNPVLFRNFNMPQLVAIEAALSQRLTLVVGPPGTGKTFVASAIAYGFVQQCRTHSEHAKVLACAFSNVGADNMAEGMIKMGLQVVRIGRPSAMTESLWSYTLDAAIDRDSTVQEARRRQKQAVRLLAKLIRRQKHPSRSNSAAVQKGRLLLEAATAVERDASNLAATDALRKADVIVTTSVGAANPQLLKACGIAAAMGKTPAVDRSLAPDDLPPLSLPFVILDEACQSVEPASLIPIVASNSCRSLVILGDPCQLPPTVKSNKAAVLELSLMERLAATLPRPNTLPPRDITAMDSSYLDSCSISEAVSFLSRSQDGKQYTKAFSGALLLSIQYRMHPSIAAIPSSIFYGGLLATPQFLADDRKFPSCLKDLMPCEDPNQCVRLIQVGGHDNERKGSPSRFTRALGGAKSTSKRTSSRLERHTSYWNEAEAELIVWLVQHMLSGDAGSCIKSIGIISPYNGQVQLIASMISSDSKLSELIDRSGVSIEIKSVDGYQGRERDVVVLSTVRSNRQGRIGFLHDPRRMNVALTRAKSALLIVGDFDTLSSADEHWAALRLWANGVRCVVDKLDFRQ